MHISQLKEDTAALPRGPTTLRMASSSGDLAAKLRLKQLTLACNILASKVSQRKTKAFYKWSGHTALQRYNSSFESANNELLVRLQEVSIQQKHNMEESIMKEKLTGKLSMTLFFYSWKMKSVLYKTNLEASYNRTQKLILWKEIVKLKEAVRRINCYEGELLAKGQEQGQAFVSQLSALKAELQESVHAARDVDFGTVAGSDEVDKAKAAMSKRKSVHYDEIVQYAETQRPSF